MELLHLLMKPCQQEHLKVYLPKFFVLPTKI